MATIIPALSMSLSRILEPWGWNSGPPHTRLPNHGLSSGKSMGPGSQIIESKGSDRNKVLVNALRNGGLFHRDLYREIKPYSSGFLEVSDLHSLYWEQSGNPDGHPVVFFHGGPGAGTSGRDRRYFDPDFFRIILFDQRGAGKSKPHACLKDNTTWDLVEDIEKLRKHLNIEKWQVFGGSWGSTLALAYTQAHAERVTGMVLRGIFLLRKKEIDWFYEGGAAAIYPDAWENFHDFIPNEERDNFVTAYGKRLSSNDLGKQKAAAKVWTTWEMMTSHLIPNEEYTRRGHNDLFSLAFARIENHYFKNKGFLPTDSYLLDNVEKIRHIPAIIVQGRYDICCPMVSAWDLHKAWPEADFKRMVLTPAERSEISRQNEIYRMASGMLGYDMAVQDRTTRMPDVWWKHYGGKLPELQKLAVRVLSQTCSSSGCERNWSVFEKIHSKKRNRLSTERLNDLVYVYYNLRLWVKQLDKEPDIEAISLDNIDTTSQWRVEIQEPEMEEAPEWLEEHADNLMEGATEEEEEGATEEVPLPVDTEAEEEIGLPVDPMPPPPPQRAIPRVGLGSVGTGRRRHTFPSTSSPSLTTLEGASGAVGSSTPTSSRVPPRPPTASRGKLVPFTRKRARAATTPRHRGNQ